MHLLGKQAPFIKQQQNYKQNSMNTTYSMMPGSKSVGNYIISKNLGEGTFGKVKLGIHSQTQEKVAIKILQKSKISDVADVERVTREINILKQVRHPNIIQLYEIIETPKQLFLVMEYVSEGELFDQIVRMKRLKQVEACEYFQQIIAGVQYLHQLGVVHRDLKPENLLIDFNRRIKLVDFGLSNTYKQRQILKTACGSPCYAAPEMIAGKKYEGLMADIWSCGVILYAMICGYLPFQDPNTSALYKKIISGQFKIPKFVSNNAKDLLKGILTTDPQKRMTLKQIKQHQWFKQVTNNIFYQHNQPPVGIKVTTNLIPVDLKIIELIKQFDETNTQEIKRYVANNRHNHTVTAYYLMLKKNLKLNIYSNSDICSPTFDISLLVNKTDTANATGNSSFRSSSKGSGRMEKTSEDTNKTIEEIDLGRATNTSNGRRIGSQAINRLNLKQFSNPNKNNYISRKREESVQLKIQLDNLPIVDNMTKLSQKRRRLNINTHRNKRDQLTDLYGVQDAFRATAYIPRQSATKNPSGTNKTPVSFRTSLDRYQESRQREDRYVSLQISQNGSEQISRQKQVMNKTFMGRIPKNSIPKWSDESERIRSILNKTITGHGSRKKKTQISYFS